MTEKIGRPTKYLPEYCQKIIDYFNICPIYKSKKTYTTKNGTEITEEIEKAVSLPTFEGFANSIDVNCDTLVEWAKERKDFSAAYIRAKELQKEIIIKNGTLGLYQPQFTIFVAKNITDMRDRQEIEVSGNIELQDRLKQARERLKSK